MINQERSTSGQQLLLLLEGNTNPFHGLQVFLEERPVQQQECSQRLLNILEQMTRQVLDKGTLSLQDVYSIQLVLQSIQQLATYSQSEDGLHILIENGLTRMINVMVTALHWVRDSENEAADRMYEDVLETISAIAEYSLEARTTIVQVYCDRLLQVASSSSFRFNTKFETIKSVNMLLEQCPLDLRGAMTGSANHCEMMHKLATLLPHAGDYEFQVGLTEALFRLTHKGNRKNLAMGWFHEEMFLMAFLHVRDSEFEVDCRQFLNIINGKKYGNESVTSFPCNKAVVGKYEIFKPDDENYSEFWVDFNSGSGRITLFCRQESSVQEEVEDNLWETVSLWEDNIIRYEIKEEGGYKRLHIQTLNNCKDLIGFGPNFIDRNVLIEFDKKHPLAEALEKTYKGNKNVGNKYRKASVPVMKIPIDKGIQSSKDPVSFNMSIPDSQDVRPRPSQQYNTRRKVSTPSVLMATPRNTKPFPQHGESKPVSPKKNLRRNKEVDNPVTPKTTTPRNKRVKTPLQMVAEKSCDSKTTVKNSQSLRASKVSTAVVSINFGESPVIKEAKKKNKTIKNSQIEEEVIPSSAPDEQIMVIPDSQPVQMWNFPALSGKSRQKNSKDDSGVCMDTTEGVTDISADSSNEKIPCFKEQLQDIESSSALYPKNIHKVSTTPCLSTVTEESCPGSSKISSQHSIKHRLDTIKESMSEINPIEEEDEFLYTDSQTVLEECNKKIDKSVSVKEIKTKKVVQMSPDSTSQVTTISTCQEKKGIRKRYPRQKDVFDEIEAENWNVNKTTSSRRSQDFMIQETNDNVLKEKQTYKQTRAKSKTVKITEQIANQRTTRNKDKQLKTQQYLSQSDECLLETRVGNSNKKGKNTSNKSKDNTELNEHERVRPARKEINECTLIDKKISQKQNQPIQDNEDSNIEIQQTPTFVKPLPVNKKKVWNKVTSPKYKHLSNDNEKENDINIYNFSQESDICSMDVSQDPSLLTRSRFSSLNLSLDRGISKLSLKNSCSSAEPVSNKPKFFLSRSKQKDKVYETQDFTPSDTYSNIDCVSHKRIGTTENISTNKLETKNNKTVGQKCKKSQRQTKKDVSKLSSQVCPESGRLSSISKLNLTTSYQKDIAESFGFENSSSVCENTSPLLSRNSHTKTFHKDKALGKSNRRENIKSRVKNKSEDSQYLDEDDVQIEDSYSGRVPSMDIETDKEEGNDADISSNTVDAVSDFTRICQGIVSKSADRAESRRTRPKKKVNYRDPSESDIDLEDRSLPDTPNPYIFAKLKKNDSDTNKKKEPKKIYKHRKNVFSDTGEDSRSEVSWLCNSSCKKIVEKTYQHKHQAKSNTERVLDSPHFSDEESNSSEQNGFSMSKVKEAKQRNKRKEIEHANLQKMAISKPNKFKLKQAGDFQGERNNKRKETEDSQLETNVTSKPIKIRKPNTEEEELEQTNLETKDASTNLDSLYFNAKNRNINKTVTKTPKRVVAEVDTSNFADELRSLFDETINSGISTLMDQNKTPVAKKNRVKQVTDNKPKNKGKQYKKLEVQIMKTPVVMSAVDEMVIDEIEQYRLEDPEAKVMTNVINMSPIMPISQASVRTEEEITDNQTANSHDIDDYNFILSQGSAFTHISTLKTPKTPANVKDVESEDEVDDEQMEMLKEADEIDHCGMTDVISGPCKRKSKTLQQGIVTKDLETYVTDGNINIFSPSKVFKPRKLFPTTELILDEPMLESQVPSETGQVESDEDVNSSEEMEEDYEQTTNTENLLMGGQLYVKTDDSFQSGVKSLINNFGTDIQRSMMAKMKQLEVITKSTMKSTQKCVAKVWNKQKDRRQTVLEDFKETLVQEVTQLEKEIGTAKQAEDKIMDFFKQQLKVMQLSRVSQQQRIQNLIKAQKNFGEEITEVEQATVKDGVYLRNTVKNEFQSLQKKVLVQTQQHEIANVKKSLQAMFL